TLATAGLSEPGPRAVVLVEGRSDRAALHAAAQVLGRDLSAERVAVVAMGGITNLLRFTDAAAAVAPGVPTAALCDGGEERWLRRATARMPIHPAIALCDRDLEDELLRALGDERALAVLDAAGELGAFRGFPGQPAQRRRPVTAQLHRFLGVASGRKTRMADPLTAALSAAELPPPFRALLEAV
ncbi:MAG: TOPRIM nucleotidyl transferase/hydrolase domain-containing protein, partial [Amnibacterium sp.]